MREKNWYLKNCQLFGRLSPEMLQNLESYSRSRKFPRKSPIYLPADASDAVFLLASGRAKICHLTPDGKQSILTFIEPGEIFGELAVYERGERGDHAETTAKSEIVVIPAEVIRQVIAQSPDLAVGITRLVGFRRRRIEQRLKYLLFHSNRERLTHLLLELAEDYGSRGSDGQIQLSVRLSHQDLASIIGSTRESVTVILGQMQAEGLLKLGRRKIAIRELEKLAGAARVNVPEVRSPKVMPVL